jgi:hypothetical protein
VQAPRHKPDLGKSETIVSFKDSPRPESQNPIVLKKKPINAAQAWLQGVACRHHDEHAFV